jgi:threonine/homoserine/homoserine lactone efflux protein
MAEMLTFILGSLSLLATPGPTNTLLAASGAVTGFRRSAVLLVGELAGYLLAIGVLRAVVGPVVAALPAFGIALRLAVCVYLVHLALTFWGRSAAPLDTARPVTLARVFVTTLLNPKAVIFAFTLLPFTPAMSLAQMAPWLAALSLLIVAVGGSWIALGASLKEGSRGDAGQLVTYKVAAVALMLIVAMIGWNTIELAWS